MIHIIPADEADFAVLAKIMALALQPGCVDRVLYKEYNHAAAAVDFALSSIKELNTRPNARIIKAVLNSSNEIVGYAAATFYKAGHDKAAISKEETTPSYINEQFSDDYYGALSQKRRQHMAGKDYCHWNKLMVLPSYQKMGIGSQLLSWGLASWPIGNNPVYLSAQLEGHKLYQNFGWQDVDEIILDLGKYMPPFSGYGLHKTVCMIKPPQ